MIERGINMLVDWSKFDQAVFNTIDDENLDSLEGTAYLSKFIVYEYSFIDVDFSKFSVNEAKNAYWATYYYGCDDGEHYDICETTEGTEVNVYNLGNPIVELFKKIELQTELVKMKPFKRKFI